MEACEPADLSVCFADSEGPRWLRSNDGVGAARLCHPHDAGEARVAANEVATLTLDDIDWRSGEMLVRAKGRQRARMPMPPDVGAAVVAYLRDGRPTSCRRLFLRRLAPNVGFASG